MSFRVGADEAGHRLDAALAEHGEAPSRAAAQRMIEDTRVTVDGKPRAKSHQLAAGELVSVVAADVMEHDGEAAASVAYEVVHEDSELLVVDKPAGVVVHPGAGKERATLAGALAGIAAGGPDPERAGIVHRLDRDTSGLLVIACSEATHAALQKQLRAREIRRHYIALVSGHPDALAGTIDAPLGRDRDRRTLISTRTDRPREAITHFELRERLPRTTLLDVALETGRTHQIRAHLEAIGHPVCGDPRYGGRACGGRLGLTRQFLHSARLMFTHPVTGEFLSCESKPPAELRRALDEARREPAPGGPDGS